MISAQNTKLVQMLAPVSQSAASDQVTAALDTLGFNYASVIFLGGVVNAGGLTLFKITECDTSGGTYTDVSNNDGVLGFGETGQKNVDGTTSADIDGTDGTIYGIEINLAARKRFLKVKYTAAGGASLCAVCGILSRASEAESDNLSDRGFTGLIRG